MMEVESGDLIELTSVGYPNFKFVFIVDIAQVLLKEDKTLLTFENCLVSFAYPDRPFHKLIFTTTNESSTSSSYDDSSSRLARSGISFSNSNVHKKQALFSVLKQSGDAIYRIASATVRDAAKIQKCLFCNEQGELGSRFDRAKKEGDDDVHTDVDDCQGFFFWITFLKNPPLHANNLSSDQKAAACTSKYHSLLQDYELNRMLTEGYILIPDVVSSSAICKVNHQLTRHLGCPNALIPGGTQPGTGKFDGKVIQGVEELLFQGKQIKIKESGSSCSATGKSLTSRNVEPVTAMDYAEFLMGGKGSCDKRSLRAQVAFRFPETIPPHITSLEQYIQLNSTISSTINSNYIDGNNSYDPSENYASDDVRRRLNRFVNKDGSSVVVDWHIDDERQGKQHNFTLLLGVCLSNTAGDFEGNLCLWPSSHLLVGQCRLGELGRLNRDKLKLLVNESCNGSFADKSIVGIGNEESNLGFGISNSSGKSSNNNSSNNSINTSIFASPKVQNPCEVDTKAKEYLDLGHPPLHITMRAGDIVLLHPLVAHNGGPNYSDGIRKMIYFRLRYNFDFRPGQNDVGIDDEGRRKEYPSSAAAAAAGGSIGGGDCEDSNSYSHNNIHNEIPMCSSWEEIVEAQKNDIWFDLPQLKYQICKLKKIINFI